MLVLLFADDKSCRRPLGLIQGLRDEGQSEVKIEEKQFCSHLFCIWFVQLHQVIWLIGF